MARSSFEPRVSIVTGAGSGIGRAIAAELVARGSYVVIADLDVAKAQAVAGELGPRASAAVVDVADADAVRALVRDTVDAHGRLDVMVNNAGVAIGGLLEELDERHWQRAIDVNLRGVVNGVSAAYTSSSSGVSTKAGQSTLTRTPRLAASARSAVDRPTTACLVVV